MLGSLHRDIPQIRVFIACAGAAVPLGEALLRQFKRMNDEARAAAADGSVGAVVGTAELVEWTVKPWWEESQGLGDTIIDALREECRLADLAVTLLTGDDLQLKHGNKTLKPRDNCIFEAGLFMGALGLEIKRSVLITTVDRDALPSDLGGVKYLKIPRPNARQLKDPQWCDQAMSIVARHLAKHVHQFEHPPMRPLRPVLSDKALFARERPSKYGGDLELPHAVVINATQPAEANSIALARQVVANMDDRVTYLYFFRAHPRNALSIVSLLKALVLARMTAGDPTFQDSEAARERLIREKPTDVIAHLRAIQERLFIHFLPPDRAPVLFCVHNASDDKNAKCYLRDDENKSFYLWATGRAAFDVASDLRNVQEKEGDAAVFYPTSMFDVYGPKGVDVRVALERELHSAFGLQIRKEVIDLCFLNDDSVREIRATL